MTKITRIIEKRERLSVGPAAWALALLALLGAVSFSAAAVAHAQDYPERSAVNRDLTIERDEVVDGDVSVTNGKLTVYGEIRGEVAVVSGSAEIDGKVEGDVAVIGGDIALGPKSWVGGSVASLGGKIVKDPAAHVEGTLSAPALSLEGLTDQVQVAPAPKVLPIPPAAATPSDIWFERFLSFFATGAIGLAVIVLGLVVASAVPSRVTVAGATLEAEPVPSIIVGLIASVLLVPVVFVVAALLAISLVGLVLLPVLAVGAVIVWLFGLVTTGAWLGKRVHEATHHDARFNPLPLPLQVLMGMAVVLGAAFLPTLLLRGPIPALMTSLIYFAGCIGLGAAILSRFGSLAPPKHLYRGS